MLAKVCSFIARNALPQPPAHLLVALSGGADSVALLLVLQRMGYRLVAAHANFHLRGDESDADEAFVRALCRERQVPLHVAHFNTREEAEQTGESIEMAARRLRYAWFETLLDETGCEAVAVAHHRDDNAETLLLNLCRGAGLRGLSGMQARNGRVVRPLLDVSRRDIEAFLHETQQGFVVDSTNVDTHYRRNFIRSEVLPLLQRLNPSIADTLHATAHRMQESAWLYDYALRALRAQLVRERPDGFDVDLLQLSALPAATTLLHEWLSPMGFAAVAIADIAQGHLRQGAYFEADAYVAVVHQERLEVRRRPLRFEGFVLPSAGVVALPDGVLLKVERMSRRELLAIPRESHIACLDADRVEGDLQVRSAQQGDRFRPYGMRGTRLISDYLTDRHRSLIDKQGAKVLTDAQGILWLVGERPDARAALTPSTQQVLLISIVDQP